MARALAVSVIFVAAAMTWTSATAVADPQPRPVTYAIGKCVTAEQRAQPEPERFDWTTAPIS